MEKLDKKAFKRYDIDINNILVSKEEPYGENKTIIMKMIRLDLYFHKWLAILNT